MFLVSNADETWKVLYEVEEVPRQPQSTSEVPFEQGSKPSNVHIGPCSELVSHSVVYPGFAHRQQGHTPAPFPLTPKGINWSRKEEDETQSQYKNVPLIAGAGDQTLFTSFLTSLAQQLPREPMEWRR